MKKFYVVTFDDETWTKTFPDKREAVDFALKFDGRVLYGNKAAGFVEIKGYDKPHTSVNEESIQKVLLVGGESDGERMNIVRKVSYIVMPMKDGVYYEKYNRVGALPIFLISTESPAGRRGNGIGKPAA